MAELTPPTAPVDTPGMSASAPSASVPALNPVLGLRFAAVALATGGALWRATAAAGLPASAWPVIAGGLALAAVQLSWAARVAVRPTRAAYAAGAALCALLLVAAGVLTATGASPANDPAQLVGAGAQLALLVLATVGALGVRAPRVLRAATAVGLAAGAITMSALVGGATHAHAAEPGRALGAREAPRAAPSSFVCHLL